MHQATPVEALSAQWFAILTIVGGACFLLFVIVLVIAVIVNVRRR